MAPSYVCIIVLFSVTPCHPPFSILLVCPLSFKNKIPFLFSVFTSHLHISVYVTLYHVIYNIIMLYVCLYIHVIILLIYEPRIEITTILKASR